MYLSHRIRLDMQINSISMFLAHDLHIFRAHASRQGQLNLFFLVFQTGVIDSDVPGIDCPASNAIQWVITVME